jgi:hypothetical protein
MSTRNVRHVFRRGSAVAVRLSLKSHDAKRLTERLLAQRLSLSFLELKLHVSPIIERQASQTYWGAAAGTFNDHHLACGRLCRLCPPDVLSLACSLQPFSQLSRHLNRSSGDITAVVSDPSGAVISGANVSLTNHATGTTETHTTNAQGSYRFSLMSPGLYTLSISAPNLQTTQQNVTIAVGQATTAKIIDCYLVSTCQESTDDATAHRTNSYKAKLRICINLIHHYPCVFLRHNRYLRTDDR